MYSPDLFDPFMLADRRHLRQSGLENPLIRIAGSAATGRRTGMRAPKHSHDRSAEGRKIA
jgi:hypothetical protein